MIDEAIGKILGMAMAYLASALGMFLAYVNYRKRTVKAQRVMTPAAWAVITVTLLAIVAGVLVVGQMAAAPAAAAATPQAAPAPAPAPPPEVMGEAELDRDEVVQRWPWIGVVVPGGIFLFATIVTAALHRHFSVKGH
jgi:hypothetical protein